MCTSYIVCTFNRESTTNPKPHIFSSILSFLSHSFDQIKDLYVGDVYAVRWRESKTFSGRKQIDICRYTTNNKTAQVISFQWVVSPFASIRYDGCAQASRIDGCCGYWIRSTASFSLLSLGNSKYIFWHKHI